jgi:hypothetical protein
MQNLFVFLDSFARMHVSRTEFEQQEGKKDGGGTVENSIEMATAGGRRART